jgi:hypothetical protein
MTIHLSRDEARRAFNGAKKHKPRIVSTPTVVDGIRFQSKREANRFCELRLLEKAGEISNLGCQVPFSLLVNRMHIADYIADFVYRRDGKEIIEDVKGHRTEVYRLKKKLMRACWGIEILET